MKLDLKQYHVKPKSSFKLSNVNPGDIGPFSEDTGKKQAKDFLKAQKKRLAELQNLLYADGRRSLLVVLQALDAGGKDSTIRKVMTGMNPQGVKVTGFKVPTPEELAHDFLWRIHKVTPTKGMIGVFNRSHYEDVLVVRVRNIVPKMVWESRFDHINNFEKLLTDANTTVIKIYLHISKDEQKKRFQERLEQPEKNWKFNPGDLEDRKLWDKYQEAFEDVFARCSTSYAPWYVVPANRNWYRNVVIAQILIETLEAMDLNYPTINYEPSEVIIPD